MQYKGKGGVAPSVLPFSIRDMYDLLDPTKLASSS